MTGASTASTAGPRVPPVHEPDGPTRELLDQTFRRDGAYQRIFLTLAHAPDLLEAIRDLGGRFLLRGELDARLREIAILRVASRTNCRYEYGQHVSLAHRAGMSDEEIRAVVLHLDDLLNEDARAISTFVDEMIETCDIRDDTWASAHALLEGRPHLLMELVLLIGFYRMVAGFLNGVRVEPDAGLPDWPAGHAPVDGERNP